MPTDDHFEEDLAGALRSAVAGYPGPSPDLVRRGIERGRAQRRALVLRGAAVAAVLTIAGVGALSARLGAFEGSSPQSTPANEQTRTPTPAPVPPIPPTGETSSPHQPSAIDLVPLLRNSLPGNGTLSSGTWTFESGGPRVTVPKAKVSGQFGIGSQTTTVSVEISRPVPGSNEAKASRATCATLDGTPSNYCTRFPTSLAGSTLVTWVYPRSSNAPGSVDDILVVFTRPDGGQVSVTSGGEQVPAGSTGSAGAILTAEQLRDVARSPAWEPVLGAQPPTSARLLSLVPTLLPAGAQLTKSTGTNEHATFTLADLGGRSELTVNLQANAGASYRSCVELPQDSNCESTRLPDGTRLVSTQASTTGDTLTGDQTWEVTAYHPNGLRVILTETNAPDGKQLVRPTPLLTLEQLRALASDPRWHD